MKPARTLCPDCHRKIVDAGTRCIGCEANRKERQRTSTKNRPGDPFYSSEAWRRLRAAKLADSPLCECDQCKASGAVVPADVVDHIKPRREHPELELCYDNLRSMAKRHHDRHTGRQTISKLRRAT